MSRRMLALAIAMIALQSVALAAQSSSSSASSSSSTSAPNPTTILTQSLAAAGAAGVQSFSAQGSVTFDWGSQPVQAPATVIAQGAGSFRMDASLSSGTRTVSVSQGSGTTKDANGTLTTIPLHNTLSAVVLTFPYLAMSEALSDPTAQISYISTVQAGSGPQYDIRITHVLPAAQDPQGVVAELSPVDYFIDITTLLVMKTTDSTHPIQNFLQSFPREVDFGNYTTVNGVAVPGTVQTLVNGNPIWQFTLSNITWNPSLAASAFTVQ